MILFLGDIHGNFDFVKYLIKNHQLKDCYIIQVGDFGVGFAHEAYEVDVLLHLNKFLKLRNIVMYAIRGNHDDPKWFKGNHNYSNLKLVEDYSTVDIEGRKILFIGGAISIDRKQRLAKDISEAKYGSLKKSYWFDEKVILDEEKITNINGCDILVTHTAPDFCIPLNKIGFGSLVDHFAKNDSTLLSELKEERDLMTNIFNIAKKNNKFKEHLYGHFHRSEQLIQDGCLHRVLGINELYQLPDPIMYDGVDIGRDY